MIEWLQKMVDRISGQESGRLKREISQLQWKLYDEEQKEEKCESRCAGEVLKLLNEARREMSDDDDVMLDIRVLKDRVAEQFLLTHFSISVGPRAIKAIFDHLCEFRQPSTDVRHAMNVIIERFAEAKRMICFKNERYKSKEGVKSGHCGRCSEGREQ